MVLSVAESLLVRLAFPLRVGLANVTGSATQSESDLLLQLSVLREINRSLAAENQQLRLEMSQLVDQRPTLDSEWRLHLSHIVSQEPGVVYLDSGAADGIKVGYTVLRNGLVLGRVTQVQATGSKVITIFHQDSLITAKTASTSAMGVVRAVGTSLEFGQVLPTETVVPGDSVLTSGADGWLPDMPLGDIESITSMQSDVFITTSLRGIEELPTLAPVMVVTGKADVVF